MGAVVSYALEAALVLVAFFLVYKLSLSRCTFFRFNRLMLLCGYVVALVAVPLWEAVATPGEGVAQEITREEVMEELSSLSDSPAPRWPLAVVLVYFAGVAVAAALTMRSVLRIRSIIRRGHKEARDGYSVVMCTQGSFSPFSWGRWIVMPRGIDADDMAVIELHERAHLRLRHQMDLAVAQLFIIFNWFNPAAYLMMRELQDVHEFEADGCVLRSGIDERRYQLLLLRSASGPGAPHLADGLIRSQLRARFRLMGAPANHPGRRLAIALAAPLIAAAVMAAGSPEAQAFIAPVGHASLLTRSYNEIEYLNDGNVAAIRYVQDGYPVAVSMDIAPHDPPTIFINRRPASPENLGAIRAADVIFVMADNANNRFIVKTK